MRCYHEVIKYYSLIPAFSFLLLSLLFCLDQLRVIWVFLVRFLLVVGCYCRVLGTLLRTAIEHCVTDS